jgi:hypothetical protein
MTPFTVNRAFRVLFCAASLLSAEAGWALTVCNSVGETTFCDDQAVTSVMNQVGDITYVSRSDGSKAIHQRVGDITFITDSRDGMSGVALHVGDTMFINLSAVSSVCNTVGSTMWCI